MKKRKHLSASELLLVHKTQSMALNAAAKSMQVITLVILREEFKWGPVRLNRFMDRFQDTLDYYNNSNDYQALLQEWAEYFAEYAGIRILPDGKEKKQ